VLGGLSVSLLPYLALTFFTHPAYDDYCWVILTRRHGYLAAQKALYKTFIGRYFSTSLITFTPLNFGSFAGYKAITLLTILLTCLSIYVFVDAVLRSAVSRSEKMIAAGFLAALFSNQTPDITEAYFWVTGNLVYQLGGILTLLFFALVIRSSDRPGPIGIARLLLGCALIAAIVGTNETSMLSLAALVFAITVKSWIDRSDKRISWLVFSIVTIICAGIVIGAPGNGVRASYYHPHRYVYLYAMGMSLKQESSFLFIWLSNLSFALATIIAIPIASRLAAKIDFLRHLRIHPAISSFLLLLIVFFGFFGPYWGMGTMGQHRTVNTVYFLFVIGWFVNLLIWVEYCQQRYQLKPGLLPRYVHAVAVPLIIINLIFTGNTRVAITDLTSLRAYRYEVAMRERYARFAECARAGRVKDCPRPTITDLPVTLTSSYFEDDISCEREFWQP
jgi:hypothetical protein